LQGSADLQNWHTLISGTDPNIAISVVVSEKPAMFFQLNTWSDGITLTTQTDPIDQYPNSFVVNSSAEISWDWTLNSSEDLVNWIPVTSGSYSSVNLVVVTTPTPALFFRLKSD
jgi:hypothetical protein